MLFTHNAASPHRLVIVGSFYYFTVTAPHRQHTNSDNPHRLLSTTTPPFLFVLRPRHQTSPTVGEVSFFSFSFHSNQNNVHWRYDSGTDSSSEYTDSEDEREVVAILTDPTPSDSYSVHDYPMTMTHHEHILQCSQHRDRVLHLPGWLRTLINLVPL